jgi:hypothetical protein
MEIVEKEKPKNEEISVIEYSACNMRITMQFKEESSRNLYKRKFCMLLRFARKTYETTKHLWAMTIFDANNSVIYTRMFLGKEIILSNRTWYIYFMTFLISGSRSSNRNENVNNMKDFYVEADERLKGHEQLFCKFGSVDKDDDDVRMRWLMWRKQTETKKKDNCRISTRNFRNLINWFADEHGQRVVFFALGVNGRTKNYQALLEMPTAMLDANRHIFYPEDGDHPLLVNYCCNMTKYLLNEFRPVLYE